MLTKTHSILVVDDESANLRMFERLLRQRFRVLSASNGEEALSILRRERVSLLISDHRMPGMTGVELLRRSMEIDPDMIRMIVTADHGIDTFISALKEGGAIRVIPKPWDPDHLMQSVVFALEKHEVVVANRQAIDRLKQANHLLEQVSKRS
ncbi:MAG TPA: response regulator [Blastocatellia bacterium]|nr:response regulator [Blastocatellia bacterium]